MEQRVQFAVAPSVPTIRPKSAPSPALPKPQFNKKQVYYKFMFPSFQIGDYQYKHGPNKISQPSFTFCSKRQLPIIGLPFYRANPGCLIVEVRLFESSVVQEKVNGIYKSDAIHISNPKPIPEFFRGCEVAVFEINPEFAVTCLFLSLEIRRFLIQKNPYNLLEFPSYTFEEALEGCKRDKDLIDDIVPQMRTKIIATLRTSRI